MTFNDKIDLFMEQNNYANLKQLAIACGIPYTTLKDFYDKKSADNSRLSTIRKLSKFMGCSMDYLSYDDVVDFNRVPTIDNTIDVAETLQIPLPDLLGRDLRFNNATPLEEKNVTYIPVLGVIKAGIPIEAQENIIEYIDIPKKWTLGGKQFYGLLISGDSMFPKYNDKDIVIFEKIEDMSLANNKDCAVMVNGDDATFKKVLLNESGIVLVPYNSGAYEIKMYSKEDIINKPIKIIGIAREKRTKIG